MDAMDGRHSLLALLKEARRYATRENASFERIAGDNVLHASQIKQAVNAYYDLVVALEDLLRPLEHGWRVDDMDLRIDAARAALAKATGKESHA